jgi:serine protease Do
MKLKITFLALIIFTFTLSISSVSYGSDFLHETEKTSPLKRSDKQSSAHKLQKSIHNIYELYRDSIVFISTERTMKMQRQNPFLFDPFFRDFFGGRGRGNRTRKLRGLGTGFIISSDGYICTNHHVVAQADNLTVRINDKEYSAKIIGSDQLTDIALLKVNTGEKLKPVHFGDSDQVRIGDFVVAIGNPFGLDKTYTFGIVSATGRRHIDQLGNSHIQTDASINRGNSGGPLINIDGEVIGVNRVIFTKSGGSIGIGFALSINAAKKALTQLKKHGKIKRGYIGVKVAPLHESTARKIGLNIKSGVYIRSLTKEGPAGKSGLRVKDIILEIDSIKIKTYRDLIKIISNKEIGKKVSIKIWRNRTNLNFTVPVAERP